MAYKEDYLMAQMANGAYRDDKGNFPRDMRSQGWEVVKQKEDPTTGFAAVAYRNPKTNEVIISYRGTDDASGDLAADKALANPNPAWHNQFRQGLEFARDIKQAYPNTHIEVTGHSLGGGIAQVTSQAYGFNGVTFDPAGAANIVQSVPFKQSMKNLGLPEQGVGMPKSFDNYVVNGSVVSHATGAHLGHVTPITGLGNINEKEQDKIDNARLSGRVAGALGSMLPGPGVIVNPNNGAIAGEQGGVQAVRHSIGRIERLFQDAAQTGRLNQIGNLDTPLHMASLESKPAIDPSALTKQAGLEDALRVAQSIFPTTPDASLALKELELQRRELALEKQEIALKNRELELRSQTLDQKEERLAEWTRQVYAREQKLEVAEAKLQHPSAAQAPAFVPNAQMQRNLQVLGEKLTEPLRAQGFSDEEIRNSCIAMACRIEKLPGSNREIHYVRVVEERGNIEAHVNPYHPHVPLEQARHQTPEQSIADLQMHQQQRQQQGQQRSGPSLG